MPFTPGPWRIVDEPYRHIRSDAGCVWADDYKPDANAKLLAAAPAMLEALQGLLASGLGAYADGEGFAELLQSDNDATVTAIERARAAIAAAS